MSSSKLSSASNLEILSSLEDMLTGKKAIHLVESGVSVFINQNRGKSSEPKERSIISQAPTASILLKKKAFSTFAASNDVKWMERNEKMLLRATKALFAFKVSQLRAYEALTKLTDFRKTYNEINFTNFIDLLNASKYIDDSGKKRKSELSGVIDLLASTFKGLHYDALREDVIKIIKRNTFSKQNYLSSWIVDPEDPNNFMLGPGTGVIELCNFSSMACTTTITTTGSSANFSLEDPYRILNIIEDDIETALDEAIRGTLGLLNDLAYGSMTTPPLDTNLIVSSAFEMAGLGNFDPTLDMDYIRDRLRVFYLGKSIVNVGDGVHFYVSGNKMLHKGNSGDLYVDPSYFEVDESILEAEKRLYTNNYIDLKTYKDLKIKSESYGMIHVFGGFVKSTSESTTNQTSKISINCDSNIGWLTWSRFMESPTLASPSGVLEDPLTPYDIKTDVTGEVILSGAPELLQENKELLRTGLLSFSSGLLAGSNATESNIYQSQYSSSGSLYGSRIIQHPHGMVYRWKKGVISATADVKTGSDSDLLVSKRNLQTVYGMLVSDSAISNLDVANAISTMVTGQPYNIETFTKLAFEAMNVVRKNDGSFSPSDAMSTILNSIRTQNKFYGNFKPFRLITLSSQTVNQLTAGDYFASQDSKLKINELRVKKNNIKQKIQKISSAPQTLSNKMLIGTLNAELNAINIVISSELAAAKNSASLDASEVFSQAYTNDFTNNGVGNSSNYDINRALTIVSSQRRFEDVKLNRDQNLLIIPDLYDINTEIKLFALNLKRQNFELFKSSYTDIFQRINGLVDQTGFEFFCNTQGHLELRPPLWNKTPLSILNAINTYQNKTNKKIVPDFLLKLFETRTSSLKIEISALNIKIAILALMMGRYPDASLIPIPTINQSYAFDSIGEASLYFFGIVVGKKIIPKEAVIYGKPSDGDKTFFDKSFNLFNEQLNNTGSGIPETNTNSSFNIDFDVRESRKDSSAGNVTDLIGDFSTFFLEGKPRFDAGAGFDSVYDFTLDTIINQDDIGKNPGISKHSSSEDFSAEDINGIRLEFLKLTGIDPMLGFKLANGSNITDADLITTVEKNKAIDIERVIERLNFIFKEIEKTISSRNSLVTVLQNNIKKQEELQRINDELLSGFSGPTDQEVFDEVFQDALNDNKFSKGLVKTRNILEGITDLMSGEAFKSTLYDHLIDDDTKNLLGPGSGKRFIIYDEDIINMSFSENPPSFTRIDVFGQSPLIDDSLKSMYNGENLMFWAGATDFDLWRQYGFMSKTLNVPYSNSAEYASKPLALMHLMMQRVKIFSGSIEISGNEYYQPGDTIYIPSKGLLFYVTSVAQRISIGSSFTTTLTLEYGHPPGIYLPTPIDIIGEQYNKQFLKQGGFINLRSNIGDDNYRALEPDGSIIFPAIRKISKDNLDTLLSYKNNQVAFYNMMTDLSTGILSGDRFLLIRGFVEDDVDRTLISEVNQRIDVVKSLFLNPVMIMQSKPTSMSDDLVDVFKSTISFGSTSGNSKDLMPIVLPNGIAVPKIPETKIITQIAYLKKNAVDYQKSQEISCLSNNLLGTFKLSGKEIDITQIIDQFPKDGPRQSSISKARLDSENSITIDVRSLERVVEIGILNLDKLSANLIKSLGLASGNSIGLL